MIEVRSLDKRFGALPVLAGVTFRIEKGESVVIIGRSGGGKSVLLKHLIGLLKPDAGQVLIEGEDLGPMNERALLRVRRKFGMLFQGAALFDSMTVAENVGFAFRRERSLPEGEVARKVSEVLEMVDLPGTEDKNPSELSGGMRKRVGLARAIIYAPQIVLYDEPTTGLDPIVADSIDGLILRVRDRLDVTTVVVTHDMRSARRLGHRILMLHEGGIYAEGTPDAIFASRDPVVRQFIDGVADEKAGTPGVPGGNGESGVG
jgi:phospholipid/cholesterol/gamma-HCH transport system ATP-binding protein